MKMKMPKLTAKRRAVSKPAGKAPGPVSSPVSTPAGNGGSQGPDLGQGPVSTPAALKYQGELRAHCIEQMIAGRCDNLEIRSGLIPQRDYRGRLKGNFQLMYCRRRPLFEGHVGSVLEYIPIDGRKEDCFRNLPF